MGVEIAAIALIVMTLQMKRRGLWLMGRAYIGKKASKIYASVLYRSAPSKTGFNSYFFHTMFCTLCYDWCWVRVSFVSYMPPTVPFFFVQLGMNGFGESVGGELIIVYTFGGACPLYGFRLECDDVCTGSMYN